MLRSSCGLRDATASFRISDLFTSPFSFADRDSLTVATVGLLRAQMWNVSFDDGESDFHTSEPSFLAAL